jgi:hypothetical protein
MDLFLDHTQRLNLHAMIGIQRGSVDEIRLWWRLQDVIALDDGERRAINYRTVRIGEAEQPSWDLDRVSPRCFTFTTEECARLARLVKEWQYGFTAADRRWLEPLLAQLEGEGAADQAAVHTGNHSRND